jgi:uncharacterized protein DUF1569
MSGGGAQSWLMKTIFDEATCSTLMDRLTRLTPDHERLWGRMTSPQAVCHVSDALRASLGDTTHDPVGGLLHRTVIRFVALSTPMQWPHGAKTLPAFDQEQGGTPPGAFEDDVAALSALIERFSASEGSGLSPHAAFGALSVGEWGRWGYRHMDHHLRQFGV